MVGRGLVIEQGQRALRAQHPQESGVRFMTLASAIRGKAFKKLRKKESETVRTNDE